MHLRLPMQALNFHIDAGWPAPTFWVTLFAQISRPHARIGQQIRGAIRQRDRAAFHDIATAADSERKPRILFHQQYRHPALRHAADGIEHGLHHKRCKPH